MYVTINDDRLHTLGVDNNLLTSVPFYEDCEYEQMYPLLSVTLPEMFSVNLRDAIGQFLSQVNPAFGVTVHEIIDLACYYYSDWDSVVAVTDEFLHVGAIGEMRKHMNAALYDTIAGEIEMQRQIDMLSDAVKQFIGIIIGVLSRNNVPAIMDYGSCYKLTHIDDFGNVYFKMSVPSAVLDAVDNACGVLPADRCAGAF